MYSVNDIYAPDSRVHYPHKYRMYASPIPEDIEWLNAK
jgi:hypothetical protein